MRALIVATLSDFKNLKSLAKKAATLGADMAELRMDAFPLEKQKEVAALLAEIQSENSLQWIATCRSGEEQGPRQSPPVFSETERRQILETILPLVDFVDIELAADTINHPLIQKARKLKKKVILSYHDFKSIPSEEKLKSLLAKFRRLKGDIFKVAVTPKNEEELLRFLTFASHHPEIDKVFIGMGESGMVSRTMAALFGSCMTYGYIDQSAAPGQVSVEELVKNR